MAEVNDLFDEVTVGLGALQDLQVKYDEEMWDINDPVFDKLRHIHIHLSVTVGKLARVLEPADHRIHKGEEDSPTDMRDALEPVLADLLMHAAQVANAVGSELPEALRARYRRNASRFAENSAFTSI
jgi:hypothetical protein